MPKPELQVLEPAAASQPACQPLPVGGALAHWLSIQQAREPSPGGEVRGHREPKDCFGDMNRRAVSLVTIRIEEE